MDDARPTGVWIEAWEKLGLVFSPSGTGWQTTHAQLPVALPLGRETCRVFFASRDTRGRSHVGAVDIDLGGARIVSDSWQVLEPGPLGFFDDHGVYPASIAKDGKRLLLYTIGWNPGPRPPLFYASIGLAQSLDGGRTFQRLSTAPIMARSEHDPCLVTAPFVLREESRWRMWYVSGFRWDDAEAAPPVSYYHVKVAESDDGISWRRDGRVAIDLAPGERNISRPCVLAVAGGYRMWFSSSGEAGYVPGYAESRDGLEWNRDDAAAGIAPDPEGWEAGTIAYPFVFEQAGRLWMLYNGAGFGRAGFGLAVASRTS